MSFLEKSDNINSPKSHRFSGKRVFLSNKKLNRKNKLNKRQKISRICDLLLDFAHVYRNRAMPTIGKHYPR